MGEDWFLEVVDTVEHAGRAACEQIELALAELERLRVGRLHGTPLADLVSETIDRGGRAARVRAAEAFTEYEQSVARMRAAIVASLVDDDGLTFSEAGLRFGISRQAAARLYSAAKATD